jgi:hypothetical protein
MIVALKMESVVSAKEAPRCQYFSLINGVKFIYSGDKALEGSFTISI